MVAGSICPAKSPVVRRAAGNRWFRKPKPQSADVDTAKSDLGSPRSIEYEKLDDSEVVRRARAGDERIFESLYRSHCRRVYGLCLRMVGNTAEAEDLSQEAFLLLFRKLHTFRGESAFSSWLHRLVVNTVLMHMRKKSLPAIAIDGVPGARDNKAAPSLDVPKLRARKLPRISGRFCARFSRSKLRRGYAEGYKARLSRLKSMVPAGGIEPTA